MFRSPGMGVSGWFTISLVKQSAAGLGMEQGGVRVPDKSVGSKFESGDPAVGTIAVPICSPPLGALKGRP